MPDRRKHRGPHPKDAELFAADKIDSLRKAASELSWLLSRNYAIDSALKVVGDRHHLVARQRIAVRRAAASDEAVSRRAKCEVAPGSGGDALVIDGFNLIVTVEAALSGGLLLKCRDGAIRDLASVHGSYRKVDETPAAIEMIAAALQEGSYAQVQWLLDSPVSNSGRLATILREYAEGRGIVWEVQVTHDVDSRLRQSTHPVVTSDSNVLDGVSAWVNLAERVVASISTPAWIVDLQT